MSRWLKKSVARASLGNDPISFWTIGPAHPSKKIQIIPTTVSSTLFIISSNQYLRTTVAFQASFVLRTTFALRASFIAAHS
jgi:hypothetical protein